MGEEGRRMVRLGEVEVVVGLFHRGGIVIFIGWEGRN